MGMKASDLLAAPLCLWCHAEWHKRGRLGDLSRAASERVQWRGVAQALGLKMENAAAPEELVRAHVDAITNGEKHGRK
jgi:hypothetical protein